MRSFTLTRNVPVYVQLTRATQIHVRFAKHYSRPTPHFTFLTVHGFRLDLSQTPAEIPAPPFAPHMIHHLNSILQYTNSSQIPGWFEPLVTGPRVVLFYMLDYLNRRSESESESAGEFEDLDEVEADTQDGNI